MTATTAFLPKHIFRLCALGTLIQEGAMTYGALAESARAFSAHLTGPSLDLMGSSMEVLRYEGLMETKDLSQPPDPGRDSNAPAAGASTSSNANSVLHVTQRGKSEFINLMTMPTELSVGEHSKLTITLKVRFIHLLPVQLRRQIADDLAAHHRQALARMRLLGRQYEATPGHLPSWLDHDISQTERRLAWFESLGQSVSRDDDGPDNGQAGLSTDDISPEG